MTTRLLFLAALVSLAGPAVHAQDQAGTKAAPFLLLGTDARGTALGSAQVASATGPAALYWNPAGIASASAQPGTGAAVFSSSEWLVDTRHSYVGATFTAGSLGTFGLQVTQRDYGDEPVTTVLDPERLQEHRQRNRRLAVDAVGSVVALRAELDPGDIL